MQRDSHAGSFLMINGTAHQHQGKSDGWTHATLSDSLFATVGLLDQTIATERLIGSKSRSKHYF